MNELIEKLAKESGYKHPEAVGVCEDYAYFSHEKFAELIVRECAEVCESMPLLGSYKEVQDATLKDAAVQIREHFGVEE